MLVGSSKAVLNMRVWSSLELRLDVAKECLHESDSGLDHAELSVDLLLRFLRDSLDLVEGLSAKVESALPGCREQGRIGAPDLDSGLFDCLAQGRDHGLASDCDKERLYSQNTLLEVGLIMKGCVVGGAAGAMSCGFFFILGESLLSCFTTTG